MLVRLEIRRTGQIKQGDQIVGNTTRVKVVKNKMAPPFKQAEFDMSYGNGINKVGELVDLGVKFGLLEKAGAWYKFPDGDTFAQGRENVSVLCCSQALAMCAGWQRHGDACSFLKLYASSSHRMYECMYVCFIRLKRTSRLTSQSTSGCTKPSVASCPERPRRRRQQQRMWKRCSEGRRTGTT